MRTMALVGFPPLTSYVALLQRARQIVVRDLSLYVPWPTFPAITSGGDVFVGLRPERIHLSHRAMNWTEHGPFIPGHGHAARGPGRRGYRLSRPSGDP